MAKRGRKQKPYVHTTLKCPHCKGELELKIFKDVLTPAVPAEIEFRHVIQPLLIPGSGGGKDKNETEKASAKKDTKKDAKKPAKKATKKK